MNRRIGQSAYYNEASDSQAMLGLVFARGRISLGLLGAAGVLAILCILSAGCRPQAAPIPPSIEFTRLPPAGEGSPDILASIGGRVTGAQPGERVVLFARSGVWWVQPLGDHPFTRIQQDSTWKNSTHPGSAYAALLVDAKYKPPLKMNELPQKGGPVKALALAEGAALGHSSLKKLDFSGYEWLVRQTPGDPGGSHNLYDPANAWVDGRGFLHLRIRENSTGWTSAEVSLTRGLGYGTYRFVISDVSQFDPPVVLNLSTWDDENPLREMDIEISRWGESGGKNAQFVVQPYYVPANVVRFLAPAGRLTWSFDWEPGRVSYQTLRGGHPGARSDVIAAHTFTSGVSSPGSETVHMNLYVFAERRVQQQRGVEVTIEKFEYLP